LTRSSTTAAGKTPLTEEEQAALTTYYELKIIEDTRKLDALLVDVKGARDIVNGHYKRMTADLGFTRKEFEAEVVDLGRLSEAEYLHREARRTKLHVLSGRKPGEQLSLIDAIQDTVDEAMAAEGAGYRAGRRADDPVPPKEVSPILHQDWMRGWHAGQEYNGLQLTRAHEIMARPKPGQLAAGTDPDEAEDEGGDDVNDVAAGAQALKDSGWAGPTPEEATFEEADGGKTIRRPRGGRTETAAAA
jgi:hypothetical protein